MNLPTPTIERLGDAALLLRLGDGIDAQVNAHVHALARHILAARPAWLVDLVPAYATLGVFVDVAAFDAAADPLDAARDWLLARLATSPNTDATAATRTVELHVDYGGDDGPDLDDVAAHAGLSPDEVVRRHAAGEYRVAMLGFAPGFPYLLGLDPALATPRLTTPRESVPAGSVAIGGAQTGLYPQAGPGGWRLIGRTDAVLFDPQHAPPTALQPGDRVRFVARRRTP
ncbi:5-oxoprolinase subunit PxpB [Chiayiivirga flava]|uniref:KipI family sensor histidine kinase inhibitor n=1 Tax=Chiayiivirga flava TaxID=659595 RepID=A0A7W8D2C6_9GAMM|nr:5-oxoprolinase subunit PxpB [Chiayiivirga flava]MBB5206695.1 KipI family sensor histidine kinase inhibitor [Chiayiivirga flava]